MWGKIIIPIYRLWLNGLYGLYGPRCPLFSKRPINLISLSLSTRYTGTSQPFEAGKRPKTSLKQMSKTKLYMMPWIENHKPNHMHYYRPYFLWSRKHKLPRQQRGIYTDLQPMQETVYWRNGKTVYRKMERTSLWHQGEATIPSRKSFQRIWQSPGSDVPCQNFELNQRPRKPRDRETQISRKPVDFHLQVLPTRGHKVRE